jgi:hypothetical protein
MSATSLRTVSLMAMVPDSECRMPTLIGDEDAAWAMACGAANASATDSTADLINVRRFKVDPLMI